MTKPIAPRARKVRVLATLGPASNSPEMIAKLFEAGADAFRVNMSHGDQQSKVAVIEAIRALEKRFGRPSTILADLQGPKLRVGRFAEGRVTLEKGQTFILDRDKTPGDTSRVERTRTTLPAGERHSTSRSSVPARMSSTRRCESSSP